MFTYSLQRELLSQENIEKLSRHGVRIIGPAAGRVACGSDGMGRMSEVSEIMSVIKEMLG